MIYFDAPAKINLFLHIVGRRKDGYHLLQSVFRLLDFGDTIGIEPNQNGEITRCNDVPGVAEADDLVIRAAKLLQTNSGTHQGAKIHVEKRIPMGGGLGGGSSDAATVLMALNQLWELRYSREQLMDLGLKLGADVPFFIFGKDAWVEGVGEQLTEIQLTEAFYAVLTPQVHVSTPAIFANPDLTRDTIPAKMSAFSTGFGHNDMETVVCLKHPEVANCLKWLSQFGDARMSGSGSSVFVELPTMAMAMQVVAAKPANLQGFAAQGLKQHPFYATVSPQ